MRPRLALEFKEFDQQGQGVPLIGREGKPIPLELTDPPFGRRDSQNQHREGVELGLEPLGRGEPLPFGSVGRAHGVQHPEKHHGAILRCVKFDVSVSRRRKRSSSR